MPILTSIILGASALLSLGGVVVSSYVAYKYKKNIIQNSTLIENDIEKMTIETSNLVNEHKVNSKIIKSIDNINIGYEYAVNTKIHIDDLRSNIELATEKFYPILGYIENNFNKPFFLAIYSSPPQFDKWVIAPRLAGIESMGVGVLSSYNDLYVYSIILNNNLVKNDKLTTMGKIVLVHEFCHFISMLMNFTGVEKREITKRSDTIFRKKINAVSNNDIGKLCKELANNKLIYGNNLTAFSNDHFALGFNDVSYNYYDLFKNLLFPISEFKEVFNDEKKRQFNELMNSEKIPEAFHLISHCVDVISTQTNLPEAFIQERVMVLIMQQLLRNRNIA